MRALQALWQRLRGMQVVLPSGFSIKHALAGGCARVVCLACVCVFCPAPRLEARLRVHVPDSHSLMLPSLSPCVAHCAELLATAMFVYIGVGTALTVNARPITQ